MIDDAVSANSRPTGIPWRHPAVFLATGLWIGRMPFAPGTWGALLGVPLSWGISFVDGWGWRVAIVVALNLIAVPICTAAVRRFGGPKDPGAIVLDEIGAMPIVFFLMPAADVRSSLLALAAGFALFRLFDITKPPPARQLESLPEGLGIMADDWAAALYSAIALWALWHFGLFGLAR
jgi:phosphatidylglycerophosphatase A